VEREPPPPSINATRGARGSNKYAVEGQYGESPVVKQRVLVGTVLHSLAHVAPPRYECYTTSQVSGRYCTSCLLAIHASDSWQTVFPLSSSESPQHDGSELDDHWSRFCGLPAHGQGQIENPGSQVRSLAASQPGTPIAGLGHRYSKKAPRYLRAKSALLLGMWKLGLASTAAARGETAGLPNTGWQWGAFHDPVIDSECRGFSPTLLASLPSSNDTAIGK
jgi:hypothetical protein